MKEFDYSKLISAIPINEGDIIDIVSDMLSIAVYCKENNLIFEPNKFIDCLCSAVGRNGTVLIRTFSHDFCNKKKWNYLLSRSSVGALGNVALNRKDFVRTTHPIFSWMVYGRDAEYLSHLDYSSAFSENSIFGWEYRNEAFLVTIGSPMSEGFTFLHYVEQKVGVPYRIEKTFSGKYIDKNGNVQIRNYSMYMRNTDEYEIGRPDIGSYFLVFQDKGIQVQSMYKGIELKKTNITRAADLFEDVLSNNIYSFIPYKVKSTGEKIKRKYEI